MELVATYHVFETSRGAQESRTFLQKRGACKIQKVYTNGPDISKTKTKNERVHSWTRLWAALIHISCSYTVSPKCTYLYRPSFSWFSNSQICGCSLVDTCQNVQQFLHLVPCRTGRRHAASRIQTSRSRLAQRQHYRLQLVICQVRIPKCTQKYRSMFLVVFLSQS